MKKGHPDETEELDRLRSEQRRVLRALLRALEDEDRPVWSEPPVSGVQKDDRAWLEVLARRRASELIESNAEWLAANADADAAFPARWTDFILDFTQTAPSLASTYSRLQTGPTLYQQAATWLRKDAQRSGDQARVSLNDLPEQQGAQVARLLLLLAAAEFLADDDYQEPLLGPPAAAG